MQKVGLPQDTESSPAPVATGTGWPKWSGAGPPEAEVVVEDGGTEVAGRAGRSAGAGEEADPHPPSTATTTTTANAAPERGGNQDGGRTSDHLCRPKPLGSGPKVPQRLCLEARIERRPTTVTTDDPYDLDRFVAAQDAGGVYDRAVAELRSGRKVSHWMWFVFPQLAGLGSSATARAFAISSIEEASAYLDHPILGPRLTRCTEIVAGLRDRSAEQVFGGVDAQKLRSSMTLFMRAAPGQPLFRRVLGLYFDGLPDPLTEQRI